MNENTQLKYARSITVGASYDVVVCGGGPSGCAAAIAAAREGLNVLLVEGQSQLGGMATSGLVSHWLGGRTQEGEWVVGGIFRKLVEEASAEGYAIIPRLEENQLYQPYGWLPWFIHGIPLDPFGVAHLLDRKMAGTGVDVLLATMLIDVIMDDSRISHVVIQNKSGISAISARYFVDATGDADIAALSGCTFRKGWEADGLTTPVTLGFHVSGVNHRELSKHIHENRSPKFRKKIEMLRAEGKWPFPYDIFISVQLVHEEDAMINTSRIVAVDGTDGASVSKGLAKGRAESQQLMKILRENFPGFENARIKTVAGLLGVRETRRIKGQFELKVSDLVAGREFEDCIGFSIYGWDLPDPKNPSVLNIPDLRTSLRAHGAIVDSTALPPIFPRRDPDSAQ